MREVRLIVPDARSEAVRERIVIEVGHLNREREIEALDWIEAVFEFDPITLPIETMWKDAGAESVEIVDYSSMTGHA